MLATHVNNKAVEYIRFGLSCANILNKNSVFNKK